MNSLTTIEGNAEVLNAQAANEQELAERITSAWREAREAMAVGLRKVIICGLLMLEAKKFCKRGELGPWLKKQCPEITWRTAQLWMELTREVCGYIGLLSSEKFHVSLPPGEMRNHFAFDSSPGKNSTLEVSLATLLELPQEALPEQAKLVQTKFWNLIDGKSQKELLLALRAKDPMRGGDRGGRKPVDPAAALRTELQMAEDLASDVLRSIFLLLEGDTITQLKPATREELIAAGIKLNNSVRELKRK